MLVLARAGLSSYLCSLRAIHQSVQARGWIPPHHSIMATTLVKVQFTTPSWTPYIKERVHEALEETSHLVRHKHSISEEEHAAYVDTIITRISNPLLEDLVDRVERAPLRKLSRKEWFIGPALQLAELADKYDALMGGVEMALKFQNIPGWWRKCRIGKDSRRKECRWGSRADYRPGEESSFVRKDCEDYQGAGGKEIYKGFLKGGRRRRRKF